MKRLTILLFSGIFILAIATPSYTTEKTPPNILFIMSDDHACQVISAYGYGLNETPNTDRIANERALIIRSCVTHSICEHGRAVMLTGKHSFVNGKVGNVQPFNWDQGNYSKLLRAKGFQTALIGKIHLDGLPRGFDSSMVLPGVLRCTKNHAGET